MTEHNGFELLVEKLIPDINTKARYFRHCKTGAEVLSLENDDENKTFGVTFRTPPTDSTGLPHIMEHSVLCGSEKYPLKEPFVELLKGSLKTFLNAFTYPDKTCYPVASQNTQDFYNLIDVYLDAVFHPRLSPQILAQEGWHYELEKVDDPLVFKGVVFNEMKGAYSSPENVLGRYIQQSLFPDNINYGVDSGGDPQEIPNLTYEQFANFHQTYYHPSNARIFFYGDDDPAQRLALLEPVLAEFEPIEIDSAVPLQPLHDEPRHEVRSYAVTKDEDPAKKKGYLSVNWLMPDIPELEVRLSLQILSYILVGTSASPLRKALIDSGIGEDVTGGMAGHLRQMYFSAGLKGMAVEDAATVETLILETLQRLLKDGIEPDMIEAAINTIEFQLRENNTGSFPRGLSLMLRSLGNWLHGRDPLEPLALEAPLAAIKAKVAAHPRFFEALIESYLLQNNHRTTLVLQPDPDQQQREEAAEKERLAEVRAAMTGADLQAVIDQTKALKLRQEAPDPPEALARLPRLELADLDKTNKFIPLEVIKSGENEILYHDLFTNGIVYLDLGFDMHALPAELLPYFPLFSNALLRVGTESEDFVKLLQRIGRKTGGVWTSSMTSTRHERAGSAAWFLLRGKATMEQTGDLLAIMRDVLLTLKLDNPARIKQLLLESKARREASLVPGGHSVVDTRLRARFSEADWLDEQFGGISQLFFTRQLVEQVDKDWPGLLAKLEEIRALLLNRQAMFTNVTLDEANWQNFQPQLADFMAGLPGSGLKRQSWFTPALPDFEGLTIPAQVNYVGKGANLYELGYQMNGSIAVITNFIRTSWLWDRVRVQGGAYGGFCSFDQESGGLTFLSYRDPNLLGTLEIYNKTSGFLRELDLSESEVSKSIIGAIGKLDAYQLPDAKGYSSMARYLIGLSDESRQRYRDEILATTVADFKAFAEVLEEVNRQGQVVVMGSAEAIAAANTERGGNWLTVRKVL
jgi:hypothetical protein